MPCAVGQGARPRPTTAQAHRAPNAGASHGEVELSPTMLRKTMPRQERSASAARRREASRADRRPDRNRGSKPASAANPTRQSRGAM
eukprot:9470782-Pyramimonas_sp.AAC.1